MAEPHVFWYGDNLQVMREHIGDGQVDLIYLDPPFNSQRVYNRFFGEADGSLSDAQRRAFEDYWSWGPEAEQAYEDVVHPKQRRHLVPAALSQTMEIFRSIHRESNLLAYLSMMAVRMTEMRRVLKQSGSLYLHCDPTASHYLKILLDALFGADCFRNEIIWRRTGAHSGNRCYGPVHDTLLFYTKDPKNYYFKVVNKPYMRGHVDRRYKRDNTGKLKFTSGGNVLTGAGVRGGQSGTEWMGFNPTTKDRHWAIPGFLAEQMPPDFKALGVLAKLDALHKEGLVEITPGTAWPTPVRYLADGNPMQDIWAYQPYTEGTVHGTNDGIDADVQWIGPTGPERIGYPTQKPLGLLERIIGTSCPDDGMVLDPFCGCGTTVVAAQRLDRQWIGIDIAHVAVSVLKRRLEDTFPGLTYRVRGEPEDVASARRLADEKWEEFQAWIVDKVGGVPLSPETEKKVAKKGKDGGIDGLLLFRDDPKAPRSKRMVISVKGGKTLDPGMIDALYGVVTRDGAAAGVLLTAYRATPGMHKTALAYGSYSSEVFEPGKKYPKIQLVSVEDIFESKWRGLHYPGANTSRRSERV